MAKDPAFLFYPNDYIGGTMGMTFEEKGAYVELLMCQFNRGHMTSHMCGQLVGQIWDNIKHKFKKDEEGLYFNVRLESEINKRKAYTDSRRNNIKGKNQYTNNDAHMEGHMTSHMENENENENINGNNNSLSKEEIKLNRILAAENKFKETVSEYISIYGEEMCVEFANYWTEPNKSHTKLKFEMQDTWDLSRRLSRWAKIPINIKPEYVSNTKQSKNRLQDNLEAGELAKRMIEESNAFDTHGNFKRDYKPNYEKLRYPKIPTID